VRSNDLRWEIPFGEKCEHTNAPSVVKILCGFSLFSGSRFFSILANILLIFSVHFSLMLFYFGSVLKVARSPQMKNSDQIDSDADMNADPEMLG
jgi:hypothetical protein